MLEELNSSQQKQFEETMLIENKANTDNQIQTEGNKEDAIKSLTLPKIENENPPENVTKKDSNSIIKRSHTSLNIFDQTASHVLKMFSAKNWADTFFNRIFQKRNSLQEQIINVKDIRQNLSESRSIVELPSLSSTPPQSLKSSEPIAIKIIEKIDDYLTLTQNSNANVNLNSRSLPAIKSETNNLEILTDGLSETILFLKVEVRVVELWRISLSLNACRKR